MSDELSVVDDTTVTQNPLGDEGAEAPKKSEGTAATTGGVCCIVVFLVVVGLLSFVAAVSKPTTPLAVPAFAH